MYKKSLNSSILGMEYERTQQSGPEVDFQACFGLLRDSIAKASTSHSSCKRPYSSAVP